MCFILWVNVVYTDEFDEITKIQAYRNLSAPPPPNYNLIGANLCNVINIVLDWVENHDARELGLYGKSKINN